MLKKLLKYDLKAMFRYWWIAAAASVALSLAAGLIISWLYVNMRNGYSGAGIALSMIALFIITIGFSAFSIMALVSVFSRFYKNFFTDEGYLTFTLPVKKRDLLNSKLLSGFITMIVTTAFILADVFIALAIGLRRLIFTRDFFERASEFFADMFEANGIYVIIYALEGIIIGLLMYFLFVSFMYCCITIGSIIVKKAKVLASVGIFYGCYSVVSFVIQLLTIFALPAVSELVAKIPDIMQRPLWALAFLGVICIQAVLCILLYILQYFMLDRKLNLN